VEGALKVTRRNSWRGGGEQSAIVFAPLAILSVPLHNDLLRPLSISNNIWLDLPRHARSEHFRRERCVVR
jgi:hypothetical protein